jgi:hypothetical protein
MLPWIAAVLLGALAPALIVSGVSADIRILPLAFAVTLGHSVILGLPIALFFRATRWAGLSAVLIGAFLIGAIPLGILALPFGGSASVNGIPTIVNGVPTLAWRSYISWMARLSAVIGDLRRVGGDWWVRLLGNAEILRRVRGVRS